MKTLAIIPARGGSKRIERKNVKDFCGRPIIAYSIEAALKAGCFDKVMVSTDDEEIADVARKYGAEVPFFRSAEASDDFATTADVIREVLNKYSNLGEEFDTLACIYATAPFVTPSRLKEAYQLLADGKAAAAFTCVEYSYPIQRSLRIDASGRIGMKYPEFANSRSQDLEKSYHDAGQFYFSTVDAFLKSGSLWGPDTLPIVLPELEVQDLDTVTDWILAEMKYKLINFPEKFDTPNYQFISYPLLSDADHAWILEQRNSERVRRMMINKDEISADDHLKFVNGLKCRRDKQYYLVVEKSSGRMIGSVNFEWRAPGEMERGIWIAEDLERCGHASRLLQEAYTFLKQNHGLARVITTVLADNLASRALEKRLGATQFNQDSLYIYYGLPL